MLPKLYKQLTTASPAVVQGEKESAPITAFFGPYSPDLVGALRTFGQSGAYYDADGNYARISPVFPSFASGEKDTLKPTSPTAALATLKSGQLRRCPGAATQPAADGSSPFVDGELLTCDVAAAPLMDRRRRNSLAASPLLIGAVTTLIVVVAVFLSYNANNGLPFVPTYNIKVALPEASGLQVSNQVRIAGTRVGVVSSMTPHEDPHTGRVTAVADLKLEKSVEKLPADTRAVVLSVSAIGLKYLELEKGNSVQKLNAGATIPTSQTREPVNIEELFNMFDKKTRQAIKINTNNFGNGLAGRGLGLNKTIHELRPLVNNAIPVLNNLASPQTDLRGLLQRPAARLRTGGAGGRAAGAAVRLSRHVLHRLGERHQAARRSDRRRPGLARTGDPLAALRGAADQQRDRVHAPAAPHGRRPRDGRAAARTRLQGRRHEPRRRDAAQRRARRIRRSARGSSATTRS